MSSFSLRPGGHLNHSQVLKWSPSRAHCSPSSLALTNWILHPEHNPAWPGSCTTPGTHARSARRKAARTGSQPSSEASPSVGYCGRIPSPDSSSGQMAPQGRQRIRGSGRAAPQLPGHTGQQTHPRGEAAWIEVMQKLPRKFSAAQTGTEHKQFRCNSLETPREGKPLSVDSACCQGHGPAPPEDAPCRGTSLLVRMGCGFCWGNAAGRLDWKAHRRRLWPWSELADRTCVPSPAWTGFSESGLSRCRGNAPGSGLPAPLPPLSAAWSVQGQMPLPPWKRSWPADPQPAPRLPMYLWSLGAPSGWPELR